MKKGAIILCGGKSSRMGRDKATLPFGPEVMLQRVVRIVSRVVDPSAIVVVSAQGQQLPQLPSYVLYATDLQPGRGPLEGLAAGFLSMPEDVDAVYATSCDVPLISEKFVVAMFEHLGDFDVAVPVEGDFCHPLAAVYRPSVYPTIRALLSEDRLRPVFLFERVPTLRIPAEQLRAADPELSTLRNINQPADYLAALADGGFGSA